MREFTVGGENITVANQPVTLAFINPAAAPNLNIEILRVFISQTGPNTSAQQRLQHTTQVTAFPTLTSATPAKLKRADPNASIITGGTVGAAGTAGINASAEGAGAKTVIFGEGFNNINGYLWVPTPRESIVMPAGSASGYNVFLPAAPGTLSGWSFGVNFGEV